MIKYISQLSFLGKQPLKEKFGIHMDRLFINLYSWYYIHWHSLVSSGMCVFHCLACLDVRMHFPTFPQWWCSHRCGNILQWWIIGNSFSVQCFVGLVGYFSHPLLSWSVWHLCVVQPRSDLNHAWYAAPPKSADGLENAVQEVLTSSASICVHFSGVHVVFNEKLKANEMWQ